MNITQKFPFSNRGVVQKLDINQLSDDQYPFLLNMVSDQEGSISPRPGYQEYNVVWDTTIPSVITALHSTRLSYTADPFLYVGEYRNIRRVNINSLTETAKVADVCAASPVTKPTFSTYRDQFGNANIFMGADLAMLKDVENASTTFLKWGILPPPIPAIAVPGPRTFVNIIKSGTSSGFDLTGARIPTATYTVSTATAQATGSGSAGYYTILVTPNPGTFIGLIQVGTYLKVGSQDVIVDAIQPADTTFTAYFDTQPSGGDTIDAYQSTASITATGTTATTTSSASLTVDASLGGSEVDGYEGDDLIHIAILNNTPADLSEIRLRIFVNGSSTDYYEKSILTNPAQALESTATDNSDTTRADTTLDEYSKFSDSSVYGQTTSADAVDLQQTNLSLGPIDPTLSGLQPTTLNSSVGAVWTEVDIPKKAFLKVGNAGTGKLTWKYITGISAILKSTATTTTASVKYGSIYAYGGKGNNSGAQFNLNPYDYIYTYFDPISGAESNPSQTVIDSKFVRVVRQGVIVKVTGCDKTGQYANLTQIRIYRRGGVFTDGLYRLVATTTNPGSASTTTIEDSTKDQDIIAGPYARFDNDPPVTSSLNIECVSYIVDSSIGPGLQTVTFNNLSPSGDLRDLLTVGSKIFIGGANANSDSMETAYVNGHGASANQLSIYLQNNYKAGTIARCGAVCNIPCPIILSALDRMWVAGDTYNPGTLYSSKTGRPEAFPTINETTLNAHTINVSPPDDPILGLLEYEGQIICFCAKSINIVRLDNGKLDGPYKTPANRGIITRGACCRVDNEIWFISYDGVYAWSGGQLTKKSLPIDFMFNGRTVNGIAPIAFQIGSLVGNMFPYQYLSIQQSNNYVFITYLDTNEIFRVLRYNLLFDRWSIDEIYDPNSNVIYDRNGYDMPVAALTAMSYEPSTGLLFIGKHRTSVSDTVAAVGYYDSPIRRDRYNNASGVGIYSEAKTKFYDMGDPMLQKLFTDIGVDFTLGSTDNELKLGMYYDYSSTMNSTDTFTISANAGRGIAAFPLRQGGGSPNISYGKEARCAQVSVFGVQLTGYDYWHGFNITRADLAEFQKGRITDWMDIGYPYDKRLKTVTLEYNTEGGSTELYLDYIYGVDGGYQLLAWDTFTLNTTSAAFGNSRNKKTFPITDGAIAKMVRLRPKVADSNYQIFGEPKWDYEEYPPDTINFTPWSDYGHKYEKRFYVLYLNVDTGGLDVTVDIEGDGAVLQTITVNGTEANRMIAKAISIDIVAKLVRLNVTNIPAGGKFQLFDHKFDKEDFPPEIVLSTPWNDFGYSYEKYAEQLSFDVNTNGYTIPVSIYGDGVLKQTINVNTTQSDRNINITLNPSMRFNVMRIVVNPSDIPSGGRFQLWSYQPIFKPADKGPVFHTFDWDDAGHPYDKKFVEMTFEYETNADNVQIGIDTLTGIEGNIETLNVKTFTINSAGRGFITVPMLDNSGNEIVAKMVRVHSNGVNGSGSNDADFKMWEPKFPGIIPYPADKTPFTEWSDLGYACDKIFRGIGIEVDTGGVDCQIYLDIDGQTSLDSWTVNTNSTDRRVFLSPHTSTELIGKLFRIRLSSGVGGKSQLFGQPNWEVVKDACEFIFFDTFEQAFGSAGFTVIKQNWIDYKCAGTVTVRFYTDNGVLFYSKQLPAHDHRYPERFYLPSIYAGVHNKSKKHRITLTADDTTKPFKLYRDSSRTEYLNLSSDQRAECYQSIIWQNIQIAV